MIMLKLDSVNAQYILGIQTVGLCYAQPLDNGISLLVNIFKQTLSVTPLQNLPLNKRLKRFWLNSVHCKLFIYIHKNLFATQISDF